MKDIIFDKAYTNAYRDIYHELCGCEQCVLFRNQFSPKYKAAVSFLRRYGAPVDFPIEIMDFGIDDKTLKRKYTAYYAVKGQLPKEKMRTRIGDIRVVMRSDTVANEAYANTSMPVPFFVIELSNIELEDNRSVFQEAVDTGREIEFSYNGQHFFESRNSDTDWYIYCEETKDTQNFLSSQELMKNTILQGRNINELWREISIDWIL